MMDGQDGGLVLVHRFVSGSEGAVGVAGYIRRKVTWRTLHTLVTRGCCSPVVVKVVAPVVSIRGEHYRVGHTGLDGKGNVEKAAWTLTLHGGTPLPRVIAVRP